MSFRPNENDKRKSDKRIQLNGGSKSPELSGLSPDTGENQSDPDHQIKQTAARPERHGWDTQPWLDPVTGSELLDDLALIVRKYLVLPAGAADAIALWTLFAHAHDAFCISPIMAVTSPTPECGKTTLLTLLGRLAPRPLPASNITAAAVFRSVAKWSPTLLIDEADTFISQSKEMRGVMNSGHHRANAYVIRLSREFGQPERLCMWAPKAVALIGDLPPTLASRSIHVDLVRKAPDETVELLRLDRLDHLEDFLRRAARWAIDHQEYLRTVDPVMPESLDGRAADNWRPLLGIADLAGDAWPKRARRAAETLSAKRKDATPSVLLLEDIQNVFAARQTDRITSADLVQALSELEDRPWPEWRNNRPISPRQLAELLEPFGITSNTIRISSSLTAKGYYLSSFSDAFRRYV